MRKLFFLLAATIALLSSCEKYDKSQIYFAEYHLQNNTEYYVQVQTSYLTSLGIYKEDYSQYQGLDMNYYSLESEKPQIVNGVMTIYSPHVVMIPNPAQWDTYTNATDTIAPNSTLVFRIAIWDNHYRKLPPYESINFPDYEYPYDSTGVVVIDPNTSTIIYHGTGHYCESIQDTQINPNINIRFTGTYCSGEYINGRLILTESSKEKTIHEYSEKLEPEFTKKVKFN